MTYQMLVFVHVVGVIILGGALIFGQLQQIRARRSRDVRFVAETYRTLYLTIMPFAPIGGLTLLASGAALVFLGGFPITGWLLALLLLFAFEMIEGITHYIPHARRLMRLSEAALQRGGITPELAALMNHRLTNIMLYLDIPNFLLIGALATFKPF